MNVPFAVAMDFYPKPQWLKGHEDMLYPDSNKAHEQTRVYAQACHKQSDSHPHGGCKVFCVT